MLQRPSFWAIAGVAFFGLVMCAGMRADRNAGKMAHEMALAKNELCKRFAAGETDGIGLSCKLLGSDKQYNIDPKEIPSTGPVRDYFSELIRNGRCNIFEQLKNE